MNDIFADMRWNVTAIAPNFREDEGPECHRGLDLALYEPELRLEEALAYAYMAGLGDGMVQKIETEYQGRTTLFEEDGSIDSFYKFCDRIGYDPENDDERYKITCPWGDDGAEVYSFETIDEADWAWLACYHRDFQPKTNFEIRDTYGCFQPENRAPSLYWTLEHGDPAALRNPV